MLLVLLAWLGTMCGFVLPSQPSTDAQMLCPTSPLQGWPARASAWPSQQVSTAAVSRRRGAAERLRVDVLLRNHPDCVCSLCRGSQREGGTGPGTNGDRNLDAVRRVLRQRPNHTARPALE